VVLLVAVDDISNMGRSGVFTIIAQLSLTTGESRSRPPGAAPPSAGRMESREARKVGALRTV
jgi:hypothetical protein